MQTVPVLYADHLAVSDMIHAVRTLSYTTDLKMVQPVLNALQS